MKYTPEQQEMCEQNILGCLINHPKYINLVNEDMFLNSINLKIFKRIEQVKKEGMVAITTIAVNDLKPEIDYIIGLATNATPEMFYYNINSLRKFQSIRQAQLKTKEAFKLLKDSPEEALNILKNIEIVDDIDDNIKSVIEKEISKGQDKNLYKTYTKLDNYCYFKTGQFITIAGRTGMGKTALACNLIYRISYDKKVYFFSLEQTKKEILRRLSAIALDKEKNKIQMEEWKALMDLNLYLSDEANLSLEEMLYRTATAQAKVLIIDNLQLINLNKIDGDNKVQKLEYVTRELKTASKVYDLNIILLAQLNREIEKVNREAVLADLRDSGSIEQDSDIVIILYEDKNEKEWLKIAKNREGISCKMEVNFNKNKGIITF